MALNVYTKNEILKCLCDKGYSLNLLELDSMMRKKQIEAIFEDEQKTEFYDDNALKILTESINKQNNKKEESLTRGYKMKDENKTNLDQQDQSEFLIIDDSEQNVLQVEETEKSVINNFSSANLEDEDIINSIKLSDGTSLSDKVESMEAKDFSQPSEIQIVDEYDEEEDDDEIPQEFSKTPGLLEGALSISTKETVEKTAGDGIQDVNHDDMGLLSNSFEVKEKLKEFSSQANIDNNFDVDITGQALNAIAKTLGKKIAKYVCQLCIQEIGKATNSKLAQYEKEYRRLEKTLEDVQMQNKKLRLLLTETNKNLNSYKPTIFGLYKKITPKK